jgi:hypothetical protein
MPESKKKNKAQELGRIEKPEAEKISKGKKIDLCSAAICSLR